LLVYLGPLVWGSNGRPSSPSNTLTASNDNVTLNGPQSPIFDSFEGAARNRPESIHLDWGHTHKSGDAWLYRNLYEPKTTQYNPVNNPEIHPMEIMQALQAGGHPQVGYAGGEQYKAPNAFNANEIIPPKAGELQQLMEMVKAKQRQSMQAIPGGLDNMLGGTGGGSIKMPWKEITSKIIMGTSDFNNEVDEAAPQDREHHRDLFSKKLKNIKPGRNTVSSKLCAFWKGRS
jgi:hypothetical protein